MTAASDPMTSVPVHASTLRLLQEFKTGAQNWDRFLVELVEREMDREDVRYADRLLKAYHREKRKEEPRRRAPARRLVDPAK